MTSTIRYAIPIALMLCLILVSFDVERALADVTITVVTPTGGSLSATSDCSDVAKTTSYIWVNCNNVLYNLNPNTYAVIGSLAVTMASSETMLGSVSGNTVYLSHSGVLSKYQWNGTGIEQTGSYSSCGTLGSIINYDSAGYIWFVCTTDRVVRLNGATMTEAFNADLTDGAGIECGSPQRVHYSPLDNIGVVRCGTQNTMATFSIASSTSATMLDSDVGTIANNNLYIYGFINVIVAMDGSNIERWTYNSTTGVTTLATTIVAGNDNCRSEVSDQADSFMVCIDDSGTSTQIFGIKSNTTDTYIIVNALQTGFDASAGIGENYVSGTFSTWYVASSLNNQRIIIISGLRDSGTNPEPPSGGNGTSVGGVDCTLPENEQILLCRIGGNGAIGSAGDFIVGNGTQGTGVSGIICSIGLVDCETDDNIQTNGIGYLLTIVALGIMIGVLWVASRGDLQSIPTFIWFLGTLALVGAVTLFGWIDPTFLVITIIVVVALATAKAKGLFGSDFS